MSNENCISCGMPMRTAAEHAAGDASKRYCVHCGKPDGTMKSYEEVLAGMTAFLQKTQGMEASIAAGAAKSMLAKMPAWSGR